MATRTLQIEIVGDPSSFSRATRRVGQDADRMGRDVERSGRRMSGFATVTTKGFSAARVAMGGLATVGVGAAGTLAKSFVDSASDISESLAKNQVLFGSFAADVDKFSKTSASSFGISRQAALEYTGVFGNLLRAQGLTRKASAGFSTDLTKLAADMASFNNTSIEDALEAIRSGLVGEAEPLRRFGVSMSDVALKAEAMRVGIVKARVDTDKVKTAQLQAEVAQSKYNEAVKEHGKASNEAKTAQVSLISSQGRLKTAVGGAKVDLDAQQKSLAAVSLITKETKNAQGDFARTSDGLANQQRILKARFSDTTAELGAKLLPAATSVVRVMNDLITETRDGHGPIIAFRDAMRDIAGFADNNQRSISGLVGAITGLGAAFLTYKLVASVRGLAAAFSLLRVAIAVHPFIALASALAAVAGALVAMKIAGDDAESSSRDLTAALREQEDAARAVRDIDVDLASKRANAESAAIALERAERRLKTVRKDGKSTALDIRQAESDVRQARVNNTRSQRDLTDAERDARRKREDLTESTRKLRDTTVSYRRGLRNKIESTEKDIRETGKQITEQQQLRARFGGTSEKVDELRKKQKSLRDELAKLKSKKISVDVRVDFNAAFNTSPGGDAAQGGTGDGPGFTKYLRNTIRGNATKLFNKAGGIGAFPLPTGGVAGIRGANPALSPLAAIGARFGLGVSSGKIGRENKLTSTGNVSYHSSGEAIDVSGPAAGMLAYFKFLKANFGSRLAELIHTPGGAGINNGRPHVYTGVTAAEHYDHVHVALDLGKPGAGIGDGLGRRMGTGDGPGRQARINRERGQQLGFMQGALDKMAPYLGLTGGTRIESLFKRIRLADGPFVGVAWNNPGDAGEVPELLWPRWLFHGSKGQKALSESSRYQLIAHELAHRFQDPEQTDTGWKSEGGAEAFARRMMRVAFGRAPAASYGYTKDYKRVEREKGAGWVLGSQFRGRGAAAGKMVRRGQFSSTAYGPPWNAMNGTGVTATGVDLRPAKQAFGIAVDPSRLKLGRSYYVWPNPFSRRGTFKAFDTGGAIKGNRIDFYDWRGRSTQMGWGRRNVTVSTTALAGGGGGGSSGGGGGGSGGGSAPKKAGPGPRFAYGGPEGLTVAREAGEVAQGIAPGSAVSADPGIATPGSRATGYGIDVARAQRTQAVGKARNNLGTLIKGLVAEVRLKRKRLKLIRKVMRGRITPARRKRLIEEETQLLGEIGDLVATIKEYRADAAGGATTVTGAEAMEAGVAADTGAGGDAGTGGEAEPGPTREDYLTAALAEAGLTPGTEDDRAVLGQILGLRTEELAAARASGDPRRISAAIEAWKAATEALNGVDDSAQRLTEAMTGLKDEMKRQNDIYESVVGVSSREAVKAMADIVSGQIVGVGLQGRRQTAGTGATVLIP